MTTRIRDQRPGRIPSDLGRLVNLMTNWQRNQWARAKYPIDEAAVKRFVGLRRRASP